MKGKFLAPQTAVDATAFGGARLGVAVLDFDHDGWMDLAFTQLGCARSHSLAQQS